MFTDECTFKSGAKTRTFCKRTKDQRTNSNFMSIIPIENHTVNVWGCMTGDYKFHVYRVDQHFNSALYAYQIRRVALPMIREAYQGNSFIFQQDNVPIHKTKRMDKLFSEENVEVMTWPPYSPDLSPIENLWAIIKKNVLKTVQTSQLRGNKETIVWLAN